MFPKFKPSITAAVLIAGTLVITSAAYAVGANAPTTYFACLKGGALSKVGTTTPTGCATGSTIISWNSEGAVGPQGPAGAAGPTGPQGPTGPTEVEDRPASLNATGATIKAISGNYNGCSAPDNVSVPSGGSNSDCYLDLLPGQTINFYKIGIFSKADPYNANSNPSATSTSLEIRDSGCSGLATSASVRVFSLMNGQPPVAWSNDTVATQCIVVSWGSGFGYQRYGAITYSVA